MEHYILTTECNSIWIQPFSVESECRMIKLIIMHWNSVETSFFFEVKKKNTKKKKTNVIKRILIVDDSCFVGLINKRTCKSVSCMMSERSKLSPGWTVEFRKNHFDAISNSFIRLFAINTCTVYTCIVQWSNIGKSVTNTWAINRTEKKIQCIIQSCYKKKTNKQTIKKNGTEQNRSEQ